MRRLLRLFRVLGLLSGAGVTLVLAMALAGLATDVVWVRLGFGLLVVVGLPMLLVRRLRSTRLGGAGALDVATIVLLSVALVSIGAGFVSKPLLVREGDRYARTGSRTLARSVYFLAGVKPSFPGDGAVAPLAPAPTSAADAGAGP